MKHLVTFIILFFFYTMNGQNLESHQWKQRVLLVLGKTDKSEVFKKQLRYFETNEIALEERKLVTYQVLPTHYLFTSKKIQSNWIKSSELYSEFMTSKDDFKVILIGLDGTTKLSQKTPVSINTLNKIIDKMPMRQSEIREN